MNKKKLTIAQISPYYYPSIGGVEGVTQYISEELVKRGHEVHVLTVNRDHKRNTISPKFEIYNKVKIHRFIRLFNIGHMSFFPISFIKKLANSNYDVIHTHVYRHPHSEIASFVGKSKSIVTVLHGHGPFLPKDWLGWKKYIMYELYDRQAHYGILNRIGHIIALTKFEELKYIKLGALKEKITIIPNVASDECFRSVNHTSFISKYNLDGKRIILFMGNLNRAKRPDLLVKALPEIIKHIPDVYLLLVGTDEGMLANVQESVAKLRVENYCNYLGPLYGEAKKQAFSSADLFILPSDQDALPLVLFVAMAYGIPVIGSDAVGPSEIIEDGVTGFIIRRGNVDDIVNATLKLLTNPNLLKKMGKKAKEAAQAKYTVNRVVNKIENLYYELINDRGKNEAK